MKIRGHLSILSVGQVVFINKISMRTKLIFLALSLGLLLGGFNCDNEQGKTFQVGQNFELALGEAAACDCGGLTITFTEVLEDSRCPTGVECVWEGQAKIQFQLKMEDGEETIELIRRPGHDELARDTVGNDIYNLLEVSPYPEEGKDIPKENYRVEMVVKQLGN